MKRFILVVATILLLFGCAENQPDGPLDNEAEVIAARTWLKLIDAGKYGKSWDQSSTLVRDAVTRDEWIMTMNSLMKQYGKHSQRSTDSIEWSSMLDGAPQGDYREVRFSSKCGDVEISETVTLQKSGDEWLVAGYFIR